MKYTYKHTHKYETFICDRKHAVQRDLQQFVARKCAEEPYISAKISYISAIEPYISAKELHIKHIQTNHMKKNTYDIYTERYETHDVYTCETHIYRSARPTTVRGEETRDTFLIELSVADPHAGPCVCV